MNIQEALNELNLSPNVSKDEVNKVFRKLALEYHPDKNKSPDAENKFKRINEAKQVLEKNGTDPSSDIIGMPFNMEFDPFDMGVDPFSAVRDMFSEFFQKNRHHTVKRKVINVSISFKTSVLGGKVDIEFERAVKCEPCHGTGKNVKTCEKCGGSGYNTTNNTTNNGFFHYKIPCQYCRGSGVTPTEISCSKCNGSQTQVKKEKLNIKIPPGTRDKSQLLLRNKGDWQSSQSSDALIIINIKDAGDMRVEENNVISTIDITLLEALKGVKKKVQTVMGEKTLPISAGVRNGNSIKIDGFGVPPYGAHIFIIKVNYPDNISGLIKYLEENNEL